MKIAPLAVLAVGSVLAHVAGAAMLESAANERLRAAWMVSTGRSPAADELASWSDASGSSIAELLAKHQARLAADAAERRAVAIRACEDAWGRAPTPAELDTPTAGNPSYAEQLAARIEALGKNEAEYRHVVERAYQRVVNRAPYDIEFAYWREQPTLSFVLLVGCIEDWAKRNQPGLMATTGIPAISVNNRYLSTLRLSPAAATELRATDQALGRTPFEDARAAHRTVIAPGAASIVSVGGIHFVAVGLGENRAP